MTDKITEDAIEEFALQPPEHQHYTYAYGPTLAPDGDTPEAGLLQGRGAGGAPAGRRAA